MKRNNESADKDLAEKSHINHIFNGVNAVPNLSYMDGATYSIPREEMIVTPKEFMD